MTTFLATIKASIRPDEITTQTRLIEAKTAAKALAHAAQAHITIVKATSAQCVEMGAAGVKIETAP